jgi:hypothetical protein
MLDELVVYLLLSPLLFGLGHPHPPIPLHLKADIALADSHHCLRLDGLIKALYLGEGMRFFLVGIEDLVGHGVISLAIRTEDVFFPTDKAHEVGSLKIGILALPAGLVEIDRLLPLPQYLVLLLQFASDVIGNKAHDIPHGIREVTLWSLFVLLGSL